MLNSSSPTARKPFTVAHQVLLGFVLGGLLDLPHIFTPSMRR
jgi:hypothetical protein